MRNAVPLVSIAMTAFNAGRFIAEAIESVLQQTESSWELLIVDDGSADNTIEILRKYAAPRPQQMQILQHAGGENRGISASRNLALKHARGSLLAFLDADDVWLPHHLAILTTLLLQEPSVAMAYGAAERWVNHDSQFDEVTARRSTWGEDYLPPMLPAAEAFGVLPRGKLLQWFLTDESMVPCICSVMVRTDVARQVGGFCDEFRGLYDDQVFHAKIAQHYDIFALDLCLARYRQHPGSCCDLGRQNTALAARERQRLLESLDI